MKKYTAVSVLGIALCLQSVHAMNNNNNNNDRGHGSPRVIINGQNPNQKIVQTQTRTGAPAEGTYEYFDVFYQKYPKLCGPLDKSENTGLHTAVRNFENDKNHIYTIVTALLANGADPHAENTQKETPVSIAEKLEDPMLLALLKTKKPTKQNLVILASKHKKKALLQSLTKVRKIQ